MFGRCVPTNSPFSPITFTFTKGNEGEGNHTSTVHHFFRSPSLEGNSEGNRETRLEADLRAIYLHDYLHPAHQPPVAEANPLTPTPQPTETFVPRAATVPAKSLPMTAGKWIFSQWTTVDA
jgi:hypothetical protein